MTSKGNVPSWKTAFRIGGKKEYLKGDILGNKREREREKEKEGGIGKQDKRICRGRTLDQSNPSR